MERQHRLVIIGDSLSQGFMSGAIHRTDISYPMMLADALGCRDAMSVPDFWGKGGLPINLERILHKLGEKHGNVLDWWELAPALARCQNLLDEVEDYWERYGGSQPVARAGDHDNLSVWGFEVADAVEVTESVCRQALPARTDNLLNQIPEMSMFRTARRVLNPRLDPRNAERSQVSLATEMARQGGIENLIVYLGANNALSAVATLSIELSSDEDLHRGRQERTCNLYRPEHFEQLYRRLAQRVASIGARRVFTATIPHVMIPPVSRGVSPGGTMGAGGSPGRQYYEYYTRPWVWDRVFDPARHNRLRREDAQRIDLFIDRYNDVVRSEARDRGWHCTDLCALLDGLAFRSAGGHPPTPLPAGLLEALARRPHLAYLLDRDTPALDTRFLSLDDQGRIAKGGLFSLDGIHPTTIGYGLLAGAFLETMQQDVPEMGLTDRALDWDAVVAADTLINRPPQLLANLEACLGFLDRGGLLSSVLQLFGRPQL